MKTNIIMNMSFIKTVSRHVLSVAKGNRTKNVLHADICRTSCLCNICFQFKLHL